ncbi:hypothetical protein [Sinorhizobium medicae]
MGQKVVCINDDWGYFHFGPYSIPVRVPMLNEVLTVSGFSVRSDGVVCLFFNEIEARQVDGPLSAEIGYAHYCFRPLNTRKTDISIFKAMLNPAGKVLTDA